MTVALKYPMGSAGSSDYVTFTPERFKFNKNRSANQASSPPADAGAVPVTLYMPNSTPSIGNGNRWTGHQMIGPIGNASLEAGAAVGKLLAERATEQGVTEVVFDRGPYLYHGRVKALAEAAREAGLAF